MAVGIEIISMRENPKPILALFYACQFEKCGQLGGWPLSRGVRGFAKGSGLYFG